LVSRRAGASGKSCQRPSLRTSAILPRTSVLSSKRCWRSSISRRRLARVSNEKRARGVLTLVAGGVETAQSVRKAAERIGYTDEVCPGCRHPRMMGARSRPRAAVLDTTDDGALPRKMVRAMRRAVPTLALPPPPGTVDRIGPICAPGFPPPSPLGASFGRAQFAPGKGMSANSKDFVCCAHERASVIARLPAADRARIFSANRSMTIITEGRAATGMVSACCTTDRQYPRID
jgi:hypothetical protein